MKTLEQCFCESQGCDPHQFRRRVFRQTLYPHARWVVPLLGGPEAAYFAAERELIDATARALTMHEVREEVRYYRRAAQNRRWPRSVARIRISTQGLLRLAREHLAGSRAGDEGSSPAAAPSEVSR